MATPTFFNSFTENLAEEFHNFESDTLQLALTNVVPVVTNTVLTNITEVPYTNCSSRVLTGVTCTQSSGTTTVDANSLTLTASGGTVGPFRYVVLFNQTSALDELICWYDYGSSITLQDTETFDFTVSTNLFTIATA